MKAACEEMENTTINSLPQESGEVTNIQKKMQRTEINEKRKYNMC